MDIKQFDHKSLRSQKARLGHGLSPWVPSLEASVVLLLVAGIALVFFGFALGWILIGMAAIPTMVVEWYKDELRDTPAIKEGVRIDDLLEGEILALLPAQPTPKDIASALSRTNSGLFFAVRFGVGGGFLEQVVSTNRDDTAAVFTEALKIYGQVGRLTAGVLILALVRQLPGKDTLLGHLQLNEDDLIRGMNWYHHLQDIIESRRNKPVRSGGIGRDWSFGWIPQLSRFGRNISERATVPNGVRAEMINQIMNSLSEASGTIGLVGKMGVGKTEIVQQLAARLIHPDSDVPPKLAYHQVFMLDASRLISAAGERGQLEDLVSTILGEAFTAKNIIVCLDNAQLFFEEAVGSVDISTLLIPILQAGRLPMILTMDEQSYLQISKRLPSLTQAMNRINIHPTSESDTLKVLEDHVPLLEYKRKVTYMYQALREA